MYYYYYSLERVGVWVLNLLKKYQKTVEPQILLEINQFMSSFLFVLASFLKDLYAQEMLSVYIFLIV